MPKQVQPMYNDVFQSILRRKDSLLRDFIEIRNKLYNNLLTDSIVIYIQKKPNINVCFIGRGYNYIYLHVHFFFFCMLFVYFFL